MLGLKSWLAATEAAVHADVLLQLQRQVGGLQLDHFSRRSVDSCLRQQQRLEADVEARAPGVGAVINLYCVMQHDADAAPGETEKASLGRARQELQQRWRRLCDAVAARRTRIEETWSLWEKMRMTCEELSQRLGRHLAIDRTCCCAAPERTPPPSSDRAAEALRAHEALLAELESLAGEIHLMNRRYRWLARNNRLDSSGELKVMVTACGNLFDERLHRTQAVVQRLKGEQADLERFVGERSLLLQDIGVLSLQLLPDPNRAASSDEEGDGSFSDVRRRLAKPSAAKVKDELAGLAKRFDQVSRLGGQLREREGRAGKLGALLQELRDSYDSLVQQVRSSVATSPGSASWHNGLDLSLDLQKLHVSPPSSRDVSPEPGESSSPRSRWSSLALHRRHRSTSRSSSLSGGAPRLVAGGGDDAGSVASVGDRNGGSGRRAPISGSGSVAGFSARCKPTAEFQLRRMSERRHRSLTNVSQSDVAAALGPLERARAAGLGQSLASLRHDESSLLSPQASSSQRHQQQPRRLRTPSARSASDSGSPLARSTSAAGEFGRSLTAGERQKRQIEVDAQKVLRWLAEAEAVQRTWTGPGGGGSGAPTKLKQLEAAIKDFEVFLEKVERLHSVVISVALLADRLLPVSQAAADPRAALVARMRLGWRRMVDAAHERRCALRQALIGCHEFDTTVKDIQQWLDRTEGVAGTIDVSTCGSAALRDLRDAHGRVRELLAAALLVLGSGSPDGSAASAAQSGHADGCIRALRRLDARLALLLGRQRHGETAAADGGSAGHRNGTASDEGGPLPMQSKAETYSGLLDSLYLDESDPVLSCTLAS